MKPLRVLLFVLSAVVCLQIAGPLQIKPSQAAPPNPTEAPTGFDQQTNGHVDQAKFAADQEIFNEHEEIDEGLGPLFNADSCGGCHQNPVPGGSSQVTELRAGHYDGASVTFHDAILRHAGEAAFVIDNYRALGSGQKNQLLTFLRAL